MIAGPGAQKPEAKGSATRMQRPADRGSPFSGNSLPCLGRPDDLGYGLLTSLKNHSISPLPGRLLLGKIRGALGPARRRRAQGLARDATEQRDTQT